MRAASSGPTLPALLLPSESRTTTLLFAALSRRRLSDVAMPRPIAVPSSIVPMRRSSTIRRSTSRSSVRGHCVNATPANVTTANRSLGRASMKSRTTGRSASSRLSRFPSFSKSSANMLVERSTASTMSMPSERTRVSAFPACGLASATTTATSASARSAGGRNASRRAAERGSAESPDASGNRIADGRRRRAARTKRTGIARSPKRKSESLKTIMSRSRPSARRRAPGSRGCRGRTGAPPRGSSRSRPRPGGRERTSRDRKRA